MMSYIMKFTNSILKTKHN